MTESHLKRYIGVRLKELREHAGLKQEDVGKIIGLSRVSILNMESGRHSPTPFKLLSFCRLFDCTLNDIFPPVEAIKYKIEEKTVMVKKKVKQIKVIK
jgi:DNA-binding XRE family transcriptional regulator